MSSRAIQISLIAREFPLEAHPRTSRDKLLATQVRLPSPPSSILSGTYRDKQLDLITDPALSAAIQRSPAWPAIFTQGERENLVAALAQTGGKIFGPTGDAALLGMKPTSRFAPQGLGLGRPETVQKATAGYDDPVIASHANLGDISIINLANR